MAIFNYAAREMTAKIVFYGPGLSGKTTSIQYIHTKISPKSKGKLVSLATETDRTLFFDFFPVEFGTIGGFKVKFNFYTVPGQVFYNTTRKLVLKGADGVVFVADSQPGMMEQNQESLANLKENLTAHGIDWETVPFVIQHNKRDLPTVMPLEEMRRVLNVRGVPDYETSATSGMGVMEAMKGICKLVLEDIQQKQRSASKGSKPSAAPAAPVGAPPTPTKEGAAAAPASPPPAAPASAPSRRATAGQERIAKVEGGEVTRAYTLPVHGPGDHQVSLALPLALTVGEGVDGVQISVRVEVKYLTNGAGAVTVRDLAPEVGAPPEPDAPEESPPKKGFFGRLFGGG
ncbi:MAG TPA: GTPase domain-containing protein [Deferrisomatales bacterium]|nr:GTPase domain-containing protein [Deferrisomatales bacterium]